MIAGTGCGGIPTVLLLCHGGMSVHGMERIIMANVQDLETNFGTNRSKGVDRRATAFRTMARRLRITKKKSPRRVQLLLLVVCCCSHHYDAHYTVHIVTPAMQASPVTMRSRNGNEGLKSHETIIIPYLIWGSNLSRWQCVAKIRLAYFYGHHTRNNNKKVSECWRPGVVGSMVMILTVDRAKIKYGMDYFVISRTGNGSHLYRNLCRGSGEINGTEANGELIGYNGDWLKIEATAGCFSAFCALLWPAIDEIEDGAKSGVSPPLKLMLQPVNPPLPFTQDRFRSGGSCPFGILP